MIYSAVTMLLMVAASAALSFYSVSVMTKARAPLLISQRRRRRARVAQRPQEASGHPYRTPPREDVQERLDQVAEAAARYVGFSINRSWLDDLSAEQVLRWVFGNLWRIAIDALLIGFVLPLLPGVQFTGTATTAVGLAALYSLCLLAAVLLLVPIVMVMKHSRDGGVQGICLIAVLFGMLSMPVGALMAVDWLSSTFNMSGAFSTILASLVMVIVRASLGSKKQSKEGRA